jgi:hypothetical protein
MAWVYPVSAPIGRPYNYAWKGYESGHHTGQDFSAGEGAKVGAASGGTVIYAGDTGGPYGKQIIIDHGNGVYTQYAHLSVVGVKVGDRVKPGMGIGAVGSSGTNSSGPHLHFEVRRGGSSYGDDINPIKFLENHNADRNGVTGDFGGVSAQGDRTGKGDGVRTSDRGGSNQGPDNGTFGYVKAFLKDHPAVAKLIDRAQKEGWTELKLAGEIKDTAWWKNRTEAQRQWDLISAESEAEAQDMIDEKERALEAVFGNLGVRIDKKEMKDLAKRAAVNGWDESEMRAAAAKRFELARPKKQGAVVGEAGDTLEAIDNMMWEYGVRVDRATKEKWVKRVLKGDLDIGTMEDRLREQAKILFPGLKTELDNHTTRELMSPYLMVAAEELGVPPEQMQTFDPKWMKPLTGGKDGRMDMDEWTTHLRTHKKYGWDTTSTAREEAANMALEIGRLMGAV